MIREPQRAAQYLNSSIFRSLLDRVELHRQILSLARGVLPETLAAHCQDCLIKGSRVLVFTDSPAWASQLRFYAPNILAQLNSSAGHHFSEVQVRNLRLEAPADTHKPMKRPSPSVARLLNLSGLDAPSVEIGEALVRLGATIERYAGRN